MNVAEAATAEQRENGGKPPSPVPTIRVLMIEDDAMFARLAANFFLMSQGAQFDLTLAGTLQEGLHYLQTVSFDVVLLDLTLPDSKGMETVDRTLACADGIPVVILTGLDSEKMALQAIRAGAQDYVVKGGEAENVIRAVRYAVERNRTENRLREAERSLKEAQLQLIQAEKMESVGCLAAGVAHEVKNPLAVLQMGIERLGFLLESKNDEETTETMKMMSDAVMRASSIIQRLLTFSTPTSTQRIPVSLNEVVERAAGMIDYEVRRRKLTVKQELAGDLPRLLLDPTSIEQALINLMLNAAQASPEGGTVIVRTRQTRLDKPGGNVGRRTTDRFPLGINVVLCEIDDSGPGLTPEAQRRLFQPFFTTKPHGKGTGLGLCVTRNILDLHGGKIDVLNRPEGGVRAAITLLP